MNHSFNIKFPDKINPSQKISKVLFVIGIGIIFCWICLIFNWVNISPMLSFLVLTISFVYWSVVLWKGLKHLYVSRFMALIILFLVIMFTFWKYKDFYTKSVCQGYYGELFKKELVGSNYKLYYKCVSKDTAFNHCIEMPADSYLSISDNPIILSSVGDIIDTNYNYHLVEKFSYPVEYHTMQIHEIGNNTYEYALFERDNYFRNFGFNIVFKASRIDKDHILVSFFENEGIIVKMTTDQDWMFLVYCNINPDYFDGWHILKEYNGTSQDVWNGGYAYLFHNTIYSRFTMESNWDILNNYIQNMDSITILNNHL